MSGKKDDHAFERLSDLLGEEEDLDAMRPDLFETVATDGAGGASKEASVGFDVEAFERTHPVLGNSPAEICLPRVRQFALQAHAGQLRRYTSEPYWKHLSEVAGLVATCANSTPRMVALAWLHDVVEDTTVTLREIERTFGVSLADGVRCLTGSTNQSLSRWERKRRDRERLAAGDADVHTVKLADMASNLASIGRFDPRFALEGYLEEKRLEVGVLTQGDEELRNLVRTLWSDAKRMAEANRA
ncbi:MAG: HD domain-containing protein [Pseudomonadota bacterium]|jgi:hypothetical protein|nr:HD domain-containing protein [Pseudomonadota bacterium]